MSGMPDKQGRTWGCPVDDTKRYNGQEPLSGGSAWRCNFCQREVREGLLLCPFCGRRIGTRSGPQRKWYHSRYALAVSLATLGPFALPMVWSSPRHTTRTKIVLTILVLALTVLLVYILVVVFARLKEQIGQLITPY